MAGIRQWRDMLTQTVVIEPYVSQNAYGVATYGRRKTYRARVAPILTRRRRGQAIARDREGREIIASLAVYLLTNELIDPRSRLTLPTGYVPQQPPILAVAPFPDESGIHHTMLYLGD
jgi:hypothetical protein